jgi:hypothetical protein
MHQVQVALQVQGKLKLLSSDNKERHVALEVAGNFVYQEKFDDSPVAWSSRYYQTAEAEIKLDKNSHHPRLTDDRRLVGLRLEQGKPHFWSAAGPLTRDEAELLDLQANSAVLADLLPPKPVKLGETWKPEDASLAMFLAIDTVSSHEVVCKLAEVKDGRAVVEMSGKAAGAVEGVTTEIEVAAKYGYHLAEQRITSLALAIKENRAAGQAEPGFEVTAKLTMTLSPLTSSQHLTTAAVASLEKGVGAAPPLRYESAEHGFRALLDPRWRVIMDRPEVAVLRLVEGGETVAQCNVSSLPPLPAGRRLQLEEFQQDIKKALAENFRQFVEASQDQTSHGLRVLRVTAAGEASELPIHWIYYHVCDDAGRRLSFVFTLEAEKIERFAGADSAFATNLELFAPATKAQPASSAPAAKQARAK